MYKRQPEDLAPDELTLDRATKLLDAPSGDRELGIHPDTGWPVMVKAGRFGPYVAMSDPEEPDEKPATASLFATMDVATIGLEEAVKLLTLPRVVGVDLADNVEIEALNGRYGPYIKKGSDSRSLETEDELFTITLEQALAKLAEPKRCLLYTSRCV